MAKVRDFYRKLTTYTGIRAYGYYIPYKYASTAKILPYPALEPLFAAAEPVMRDALEAMDEFAPELRKIGAAPGDPSWRAMFPPLDAAIAYTMVRTLKPRRIVEVGSGTSTGFMARAITDGNLSTDVVCIDPKPRKDISHLPVRHIPHILEDADISLFEDFRNNDILFIDSSHIAMPGTDVDRIFLDVLPRLKSGSVVHFHDVFLPERYPKAWDLRGYNEQILVGALIQGNKYEIMFASHYIATTRLQWLLNSKLSDMNLIGGSIWLRKH